MSTSRISFRTVISLFALGSVLAFASGVRAAAGPPVDCLASYRVGPVEAYQEQNNTEYRVYDTLAGARIFVYAEPGLTGEWLEYQLEQRAKARITSQCPVDVQGVRVSVRSGGPGFWVTLSSDQPPAAAEILRRARLLTRP